MAKNSTYTPDPEMIEKYLAGNMSEQDRLAYEKEIDASPELKADIKEAALAKWTIQAYARKEEKAELDALYKANEKEAQVISLLHYKWMTVAAVVAMLLLSYFLFRPSASLQMQDAFASYYELPQAPDIMGPDTEEMLRKADLAYEGHNWSEALRFYTQIEPDSLSAFQLSRISLFQGIAHLELGEWEQAKQSFESTPQHPEQADWFLAMLYLKKEDRELVSGALKKIIDTPEHFYQKRAKELYDKLEL